MNDRRLKLPGCLFYNGDEEIKEAIHGRNNFAEDN